jgi:GTP cyclohydrolase II
MSSASWITPFESVHGGPFRLMLYRDTIEGGEHVALVHGKIEPGKPTLVRMHQVDFAADLLGHVEDRQNYIPAGTEGDQRACRRGRDVFLRDPDLHGLAERLPGVAKPVAVDRAIRNYGVGAQILLDLGVRDMIVMSSTRPNRLRSKATACASSAGVTWTEKTNPERAHPRPHRRGALLRRSGRRPAGRGEGRPARAGVEFDVVSVPGALEVPTAIALAVEAGRYPTAPRYDGFVALGCVIRGETYHFEIVSDQSAAGMVQPRPQRRGRSATAF